MSRRNADLGIAECRIDFSLNPELSTVPRRSQASGKQVIFNLWLPFPEAPWAGQRYSSSAHSAASHLWRSHLVLTLLSTQPARVCVVVPPWSVDVVSWLLLLSSEPLITKASGKNKTSLGSLFKGAVSSLVSDRSYFFLLPRHLSRRDPANVSCEVRLVQQCWMKR